MKPLNTMCGKMQFLKCYRSW